MPSKIPEASKAPNALLMMFPQYNIAVRRPISSRLYLSMMFTPIDFNHSSKPTDHFEITKRAPGKNAASTKPRKNRVSKAPVKLECVEFKWGPFPGCCMDDPLCSDTRQSGNDAPDNHTAR